MLTDLREGSNLGGTVSLTDGTGTVAVCALASRTGAGGATDASAVVAVSSSEGDSVVPVVDGVDSEAEEGSGACIWTDVLLPISPMVMPFTSQL